MRVRGIAAPWGRRVAVAGMVLVIVGAFSLVGVGAASAATTGVSDEAGFRSAFGDEVVTSIVLTAPITLSDCGTGPVTRNGASDVAVDGGGFSITQNCDNSTDLWQQGSGAVTLLNLTISQGAVAVLSDGGPISLANSAITNIHGVDINAYGVWAKSPSAGAVTIAGSRITGIGASCCTGPGAVGDVVGAQSGASMTVTDSSISQLESGNPGRATGLVAAGDLDVSGSIVSGILNDGFGPSAGIRSTGGRVGVTDSEVTGIGGIGSPLAGVWAETGSVTVSHSRVHDVVLNNSGSVMGIGAAGSIALIDSSVLNVSTRPGYGPSSTEGVVGLKNALVSVTRSTVANTTPGSGGGAAGIVANGDVVLTNATVTANQGNGVVAANEIRLAFSDVVDNGAPDANSRAQVLAFGIISSFGSVIARARGIPNCEAHLLDSDGHNFADDESCSYSAVGDRQGAGLNPQLGPLSDNGGPTLTMLPSATSPLVRAIDPTTCQTRVADRITTDQRGLPRANPDGCDIGAVELQSVPVMNPPRFTG